MNRYEELAKKALADQQARKAAAEAEEHERRARIEADEADKREYLEVEVMPILRDAAKGLSAAGIPAEFGRPEVYLDPAVVLRIGHNQAGRTGHRQATLTARPSGANLQVEVTTIHGSQGRWQTPKGTPSTALDPAIEKCIDIWTEAKRP